MSAADDTKPEKVFRLSMLIYDTRFRSMTIQVIALMLLMLVGAWLVNNTLNNLAILDKELGFQFLAEPAGYDINQRLIEYTSRSSHARAAFVGILNTLLVAFLGCITATLLGVGAGIARLSKNWVVARLMTVYVEMFRNIPLLLWILVMSAIFIHSLPQPRAFRGGAEAEAHMSMWDAVAFTNRGFYIPRPVYNSGSNAVIIVFLLSIVAILGFGRWARKRQNRTGDILPTGWIKLAIFFAPATLVFFIMGQPIDLEYPALKGFNFVGGFHLRNSLIALWFALSLYTGAFIAEAVRAGIQSVSKGQSEAAAALGLRPKRVMNLVVLPQALRVIIPPLISQYLNLTKNSSLAIAVGYMDITATLGGITLNQTGREMESLLLLMVMYLSISLTVSMVMNWYNNSIKTRER